MKPFLTGKKQLEVTPLRFPSTPSPLAAAAAKAARGPAPAAASDAACDGAAGTPRVEVVREGEKVVRLVVTCSCGERIEVDCQYPSEG